MPILYWLEMLCSPQERNTCMNLTPNASPAPSLNNSQFVPAQPVAKRGRLFYLGLAAVIIGGICCLMGLAALILYGYFKSKPAAPAATPRPTLTATNPSLPVFTPTDTSLPASTATPTEQSTTGNTTKFSDDFSNPNSGWIVVSTANSEASYDPLGFYTMDIKTAEYYRVSVAPDNLPQPLKNVLINVRAQPGLGNTGEYGVVCRYQDIDNFYLAGISGDQFYIGKQVGGNWTYLTDPKWQTLPDNTPDADGYLAISMSCIDSFIVLEVNGIGAAHVTDDSFSSGAAGLCVWGSDKVDKYGYYARAGFDDFSVELAQP